MASYNSFDSKGFIFTARLLAICLVLGTGARYGIVALGPYIFPATQSVHAPMDITAGPLAAATALSTTTPQRIINALTATEVVPQAGKFIVADLVHMTISLYENGTSTAQYPILTKGRPGTPYETPSGVYSILYKEENHVNGWEHVSMPYSMEFYGNYFIHGWPMYADGTPVASTYSGGCIRVSTEDASKIYAFADKGTGVFVYDPGAAVGDAPSLALANPVAPPVSADAYLVADLDTGDVYAEQNAQEQRPIASVTKLMTALVANETIMFDRPISVPRGILKDDADATDTVPETFVVGDLLYPLLMESNNNIADALASYYNKHAFVGWMNSQAAALDMNSTTFADSSGVSPDNISTPEDLFRLAVYIANKKSFVWKITRTPQKSIVAKNGSSFTFNNFNKFSGLDTFVGGKVGHTSQAQDTMVSVFSALINGKTRRVAVIVLGSKDYTNDTQTLAEWFSNSAMAAQNNTACATCSLPQSYEKIPL